MVGTGGRLATARSRTVQLAVVAIAASAGLLSLIVVVLVVVGPAEPTWLVILFPVLGAIYVLAGAVAWLRRPSNQLGALLVFGGLCWLGASLGNTEHGALIAVGQIMATAPLAVIVHTLLAFPSGHLRDRGSRLIIASAYITAILLQAPLYLFTPDVPPYAPLNVAARPDLASIGLWSQRVLAAW